MLFPDPNRVGHRRKMFDERSLVLNGFYGNIRQGFENGFCNRTLLSLVIEINSFNLNRQHLSLRKNPKSEYRAKRPSRANPKQSLNPNSQISKSIVLTLVVGLFGFVSCFGSQISNLNPTLNVLHQFLKIFIIHKPGQRRNYGTVFFHRFKLKLDP